MAARNSAVPSQPFIMGVSNVSIFVPVHWSVEIFPARSAPFGLAPVTTSTTPTITSAIPARLTALGNSASTGMPSSTASAGDRAAKKAARGGPRELRRYAGKKKKNKKEKEVRGRGGGGGGGARPPPHNKKKKKNKPPTQKQQVATPFACG